MTKRSCTERRPAQYTVMQSESATLKDALKTGFVHTA